MSIFATIFESLKRLFGMTNDRLDVDPEQSIEAHTLTPSDENTAANPALKTEIEQPKEHRSAKEIAREKEALKKAERKLKRETRRKRKEERALRAQSRRSKKRKADHTDSDNH